MSTFDSYLHRVMKVALLVFTIGLMAAFLYAVIWGKDWLEKGGGATITIASILTVVRQFQRYDSAEVAKRESKDLDTEELEEILNSIK